jgi:hypothetical protein
MKGREVTMRIFRFDKASYLDDCWQKSVISTASLPCFNEDIAYILREIPKHDRKNWLFGFTKSNLLKLVKPLKLI